MGDQPDGDHSWCDRLHDGEIAPVSAEWHGVLFSNPRIGLEPALHWTIVVKCRDVVRDCGDSPVSLAVDWLPFDVASWRDVSGVSVSCDRFAEPAEASVYFFEHYPFDRIRVRALSQAGRTVRFAIELGGDLEGVGLDEVAMTVDAEFSGILAYRHCPPPELFTDIAGLTPTGAGEHGVWLLPVSEE